MNNTLFNKAKSAYNDGDFINSINLFNSCLNDPNFNFLPGEYGLICHRIGNCYVKINQFENAIEAYVNATKDTAYDSLGVVYYNIGMSYDKLNDFSRAIENFNYALNIDNYKAKYRALTAMGNALMKSGNSAEAGVVFRKAAMDPNNPDPTRALLNLGVCFMALGRPQDAVLSYKSAFNFDLSPTVSNRLYANLGQAYVACGEMQNAVEMFEHALQDKTYELSDSASVDYQRAVSFVSKGQDVASGFNSTNSNNNDLLYNNNNSVANNVDESNSFYSSNNNNNNAQINSNNSTNTGFKNQSSDSLNNLKQEKGNSSKVKKPKPNKKRVIFSVVAIVVSILLLTFGFLFWQGYGLPSQESVTYQLFQNPISSKNTIFDNSVDSSKKDSYISMISQNSNPLIKAVDRQMMQSYVYVQSKTSAGGVVEYKITMSRDILGWKVHNVDLNFASKS